MIKAIQTVYKGYKFRSRLEARWAVFFDALREKSIFAPAWNYEPEGFDLDGEYYLPDFRLDYGVHSVYVEIKANKPTERELIKGKKLAFNLRQPFYFLCGIPDPDIDHLTGINIHGFCFIPSNVSCDLTDAHFHFFNYFKEQLPEFLQSQGFDCDNGNCFEADAEYFMKKHNKKHPDHCRLGRISEIGIYTPFFMQCCRTDYLKLISYAATKARQARFEHGEKPL